MQRSVGNARVILSIQYLRAVAALSVAVYHIGNHAGVSFEVGAAGVDLFFVISGFIMWTVTAGRRSGPGPFLGDRITRIAPPYILLTVLTYLTARYVPAVFPNMRTNLSHVALSVLFVPHVDPQGTSFPQIVSGWTLTYEMFFYVVFAIMLLVPERARMQVSTAVLVLLPVLGLLVGSSSPIVRAYTSPLLLEFCAGLRLGAAWRGGWLPGADWGRISLAASVAGCRMAGAAGDGSRRLASVGLGVAGVARRWRRFGDRAAERGGARLAAVADRERLLLDLPRERIHHGRRLAADAWLTPAVVLLWRAGFVGGGGPCVLVGR